jgi:dienelactone hydrolase
MTLLVYQPLWRHLQLALSMLLVCSAGWAQPAFTTQSLGEVTWLSSAPWRPGATTIVALHGCGGLYNRRGTLDSRSSAFANEFLSQGYNLVFIDSFSGRGVLEICSQPVRQRTVTVAKRSDDVYAALSHLNGLQSVAPYVLVGWSNGGSTALQVLNSANWPAALPKPRLAFVFYPGCEPAERLRLVPVSPTTVLLGAKDNWTPPEPCLRWADNQKPLISTVLYENATHGFDSPNTSWRELNNVPRLPGQAKVTVGTDTKARSDAYERLSQALKEIP